MNGDVVARRVAEVEAREYGDGFPAGLPPAEPPVRERTRRAPGGFAGRLAPAAPMTVAEAAAEVEASTAAFWSEMYADLERRARRQARVRRWVWGLIAGLWFAVVVYGADRSRPLTALVAVTQLVLFAYLNATEDVDPRHLEAVERRVAAIESVAGSGTAGETGASGSRSLSSPGGPVHAGALLGSAGAPGVQGADRAGAGTANLAAGGAR